MIVTIFLWRAVLAYPAGVNDPLEQPVPFSRKHHVGDEGIDCRYCHSSVETSGFAGIPPLSTCMTCHSQLFTDQPALAPLISAFQSGVPLHWQWATSSMQTAIRRAEADCLDRRFRARACSATRKYQYECGQRVSFVCWFRNTPA